MFQEDEMAIILKHLMQNISGLLYRDKKEVSVTEDEMRERNKT